MACIFSWNLFTEINDEKSQTQELPKLSTWYLPRIFFLALSVLLISKLICPTTDTFHIRCKRRRISEGYGILLTYRSLSAT